MKKAVVILLLVLYSASTMGATINMHYCMDRFAGFSFSSSKKEKCAKCGMSNTGCCKDEKKQIKLSLDQQKTECIQSINLNALILVNSFIAYNSFQSFGLNTKLSLAYLHAPPLILKKDRQSLFSTFLI